MKKLQLTIIALALLPLFSFSQDYWELIHTNDTSYIWSIQIAKDGTIYYGGSSGLFISHDDGQTWDYKYLHINRNIYGMAFDMDSNLICGANNGVYKYKIIEDEWELLYQPEHGGFESILVVEDTIYAVGASGSYRYTDGNWGNMGLGGADIVEDNEGRLFIGSLGLTGGGRVWQSLDKGETWVSIGLYDSYIADLAVDSQGRLYAGSVGNNEYYISGFYRYNRDEGIWDTLRLYYRVECICFNEEDSLYIGQYSTGGPPAGAVFSPDYGETWNYVCSGFNGFPNVRELLLGPDNHLYSIVEFHSIYYSTNATITSTPENLAFKEYFEVYPNPFNDKLYIKNSQYATGPCRVKIFTVSGRLIYQGITDASNVSEVISLNKMKEVKPGVYILQITSAQVEFVKKIIKY